MKRKYLDDLKVNDRWDQWECNKDRMNKLKRQRKKYGIDSRECYSLDETFYEWLYEHLMLYLEDADSVIDLESENANHWDYGGESRSQKWLIERAIENLKYYLTNKNKGKTLDADEAINAHAIEAAKIFVMMLPAMWW